MATITDVKKYFGVKDAKEFRREWEALSPEDKEELKKMVGEIQKEA